MALALVAAAPAGAAQIIAPRDVSAALAVARDGRAFVVSPSARPDSGTLAGVRRRSAAPSAAFGPSRTLLRSSAANRAVDAGVAADGSGLVVVQSRRGVRAVAFDAGGRLGPPQWLSAPRARADFAASAVASSGAAVGGWVLPLSGRWGLEAPAREPTGAPVVAP